MGLCEMQRTLMPCGVRKLTEYGRAIVVCFWMPAHLILCERGMCVSCCYVL